MNGVFHPQIQNVDHSVNPISTANNTNTRIKRFHPNQCSEAIRYRFLPSSLVLPRPTAFDSPCYQPPHKVYLLYRQFRELVPFHGVLPAGRILIQISIINVPVFGIYLLRIIGEQHTHDNKGLTLVQPPVPDYPLHRFDVTVRGGGGRLGCCTRVVRRIQRFLKDLCW